MNDQVADTPLVDQQELVDQWRLGIRIIHTAHTRAAADFAFWERTLGLAVAIATAITGSTIFAAAGSSNNQRILFVAGAVTIAASVLAAAHTFLGFGARAAGHEAAAKEYGVLRKEFEASLACGTPGDTCALLQSVRTKWNEIEAKYQFVSQKRYAAAQRDIVKAIRQRLMRSHEIV